MYLSTLFTAVQFSSVGLSQSRDNFLMEQKMSGLETTNSLAIGNVLNILNVFFTYFLLRFFNRHAHSSWMFHAEPVQNRRDVFGLTNKNLLIRTISLDFVAEHYCSRSQIYISNLWLSSPLIADISVLLVSAIKRSSAYRQISINLEFVFRVYKQRSFWLLFKPGSLTKKVWTFAYHRRGAFSNP